MRDKDKTKEQLVDELAKAREGEARFRGLLDNMPDVAFRWSVTKGLEYVSPSVQAVTGYAPADLTGADPMKGLRLAKSKQKDINDRWKKSIAGEGAAPFEEFTFVRKDGSEGYLELRSVPVMDKDGKLIAAEGVLRDITERKKMEQKLRESEQKFRETFEHVGDVIYRIDAAGKFEMINDRVFNMFGYRPEELIGRSLLEIDVFPADEMARVAELFTDSVAKGTTTAPRLDIRAKHKDGHEVLIEVNVSSIIAPEGQFQGFMGVIRDIGTRKRMEAALAESEARFRRLLDNIPDVVFRWNLEKGLEYVSPSVLNVTGYTPEELMGADPMKGLKIAKSKRQTITEDWRRSVTEEGAAPMDEFVFERKDGTTGYLEVKAVPIMDEKGNMVAAEGILRDISRRKQMEEALRESEARFRRLLDNIPDVVFRWDMQKGLEYASPSVFNVTGYTQQELMGADPMKGLKLAQSKRETIHEEWTRSVTEEGAPPMDEFVFERKDGTTGYLEVRSVPITDDKGNLVAAEGILIDITKRKKMEEELLRHRDNLEQMVQERTAELTKTQEIATRQAQEIIEISTPIILLRRGILLAPLIGTLNSERAQQFTERLLNAIAQTNSTVALVDITGVPTVDTQTAHYITRTISAVRLLGAQAILTGVGPSLASTLVELGIDLSSVITRSSLADGLEDAMKLLSTSQR